MKKMIIQFPAVILAGTLLLLLGQQIPAFLSSVTGSDQSRRDRFESFLKEVYKQAPQTREKGSGKALDQPGTAAFQDYLMTLDPATGVVPRERLLDAYRTTRHMESRKQSNSLTWEGTGSEIGGRTRAIMYDPNDPDYKKVWAGGVTGGLWYNPDISNPVSSWIPVGDFWPVLTIRCITYDPTNPQVFYIGTGEPETALITYRESSGLGQGIWKSEDGGSTWEQLPSSEGFAFITDIVVRDENGTSAVYAGVVSGQYHGVHASQPSDGLYRSVDGGNTWEQVLPDIIGGSQPYAPADVALGPGGRLYVGTAPNLDDEGGATILYSDTGLPGSWVINDEYKIIIENDPDLPLPGRVILATAESDENIVYALVASGYIRPSNNFKYFYCYHILRSADRGETWTEKPLPQDLTSGNNFATIAWHALDAAVDPNNPDNLFIGGLDVHHSTNGGNTWYRVSDWAKMYSSGGSDYIHADQHIIVYKPGSSQEILFGTDGGVFYTYNGIVNYPAFEPRNNEYNTLQFYTCAISPTAGSIDYLGGLQDNGSFHYSGNPLTLDDMWSGGDGAYCFYDRDNAALTVTSIYYNTYYVFMYGGWVNSMNNWSSGTFISPADFDFHRNEIYANAVDYVGNYADRILRLKNILSNESGSYIDINTGSDLYFSAVTYSPYSTSTSANLFLGNQQGRVFKAENMNLVPQISEIGSSAFPVGNISCIAVGASEDTLVVTFSNYGVPSVWITTNGGQSWMDAEGNLPDMPVRWALMHPDYSRNVMLATETGVWMTTDILANPVVWEPETSGMANVRTDMLRLRESDYTVLAASHGRGLYTTVWDAVIGVNDHQQPFVTIYPNPAHDYIRVSFPESVAMPLEMKILSIDGKVVMRFTVQPDGSTQETFSITNLPVGVYMVLVEGEAKTYFRQKLIVI